MIPVIHSASEVHLKCIARMVPTRAESSSLEFCRVQPILAEFILNSAKVQKKFAVCKHLGQKSCVLTLHFAQILLYINKVSDWAQKREWDGSDIASHSRASCPLNKGLPNKKGRKGETFSNSSNIRDCIIKGSHSVRLMKSLSPTGSDSQSVTSELAVRPDGLILLTDILADHSNKSPPV